MLGIVTMAGNALRAFGNTHPAVKWGVIVLAGLLAVEFVGKEAVSLWVAVQTAPAQVEQARVETQSKIAAACAARLNAPRLYETPQQAEERDRKNRALMPECFDLALAANQPAIAAKPAPFAWLAPQGYGPLTGLARIAAAAFVLSFMAAVVLTAIALARRITGRQTWRPVLSTAGTVAIVAALAFSASLILALLD